MADQEQTVACQTFTHHVRDCIRVECAQHPKWLIDVEATKRGVTPNARQIATQAQRDHEAMHARVDRMNR